MIIYGFYDKMIVRTYGCIEITLVHNQEYLLYTRYFLYPTIYGIAGSRYDHNGNHIEVYYDNEALSNLTGKENQNTAVVHFEPLSGFSLYVHEAFLYLHWKTIFSSIILEMLY